MTLLGALRVLGWWSSISLAACALWAIWRRWGADS